MAQHLDPDPEPAPTPEPTLDVWHPSTCQDAARYEATEDRCGRGGVRPPLTREFDGAVGGAAAGAGRSLVEEVVATPSTTPTPTLSVDTNTNIYTNTNT